MYKLTLIITSTLKRAWYAILIAILSMALLFSSLVLGAGQESHPAVNLASTPIAISAQGYPNGQRPFLIRKPFRESYQNSLWVNSFFDHKLPVQLEFEGNPHIPADLQDVTHVINFLNESEFGVRTDCVLGLSCYSGHEGIDYNTGYQEIIAPANGIIRIGSESYIGTGVNRKQNNCHIWIDHDASNPGGIAYNFSTHYLHLSRIGDASANALAQPRRMSANREWVSGDKIRAGETIGISGNDPCGGSGTGAHLHFGVAAGAANERGNSRIFDPFGWWYNGADSWNDDRLNNPSIPISARPTRSLWAWAAPQNPGTGNPGYWGEGILAQTDDTDTSFQKFGLSTRREGANGWNSILSNSIPGIQPIGTGAWWSKSPTQDTNKNWAIWGLHVPADGQYRIQAHFPKLPQGINATTNARYTLHIPTSDTAYDIWTSSPINQQANNQWRYIGKDANNTMLSLRANTVVLVMLSDFTGTSGEAVIFDAIRLEAATPVQPPPPPPVTGRVAFAIDNSSSMQESGKISAVKTTLSTWVNELVTSGIQFNYALEPFANNTPPVQQTTNPDQIKSWINALSANDNGVSNGECPEESLEAIEQLAPFVKNGNMLLFTDDLPLSPVAKTITAFSALSNNKVKLNAIILPKTCNFGGNDPSGWLPYRFLSFITGGIYQTVTPDKTALALQIVFNEMQAQTQLNTVTNNTTNTSASAIQGTTVVANPIIVDDSVIKMNVLLNILSGGFTLNLIRPDGTVAAPTDVDVTYIDSGSAQYYEIATPKPGTWQASVNGQGEYKLSTSADTSIQFAYFGDTRGAPNAPIELVASLSGPVASSTFVIEQQNGQEVATVMLHDDGQQNDFVAGDNLYSGWYIPAQLGDFHLRVSGTTTSGQNFNRVDSRLIRIQGLRVIAPPSVLIANGASQELRFQVTNLDNISQIYQLSVTSDNGWIEQFPPQSITLAAGSTAEILVIIRIPTDAAANSVDKIWLTAIKQSDGTIIAEDNTLIFTPDANSPELSHLPGDCNADQAITASDVTALALEFFDGDDNSNPLATSGGAYAGSPACDANEDSQIGASDVTCIARLFFNGAGACRLAADATVATQPVLSLPSQIAAETNSQVTVPIELRSNGSAVGSLLFSVDYDETTLTFDPADHDQDGIPDAITFHLPAQMLRSVSFDPTDHAGELDLMLADFAATPAALPTGPLVSITLKTGAVAELTTAVVKFADRPAPSFGGIAGQTLAGASEGGAIFIHGPTDLLVLPLKNYLPLVAGQE